jgi:hypothetical protein
MKLTRRNCLRAALATSLLTALGSAQAAAVTLEIIAFAHPPVQNALKPLRDWLPGQGSKLKVIEIDMALPLAQQRLQALGLKGHLPIVLVINGQFQHKRANGSAVEFVSFPAAPAGAEGKSTKGWSVEDAKAVLAATLGK